MSERPAGTTAETGVAADTAGDTGDAADNATEAAPESPAEQVAAAEPAASPEPAASTESPSDAAPAVPTVGLAQRVQARLSRARDEHRTSAAAPAQSLDQQAPRPATAARKPARRARLRLARIDPWSVMKTSFLLSIAFGVVTVVSVLMVWSVLGAAGVWESINTTVQTVLGEDSATQFDIEDYLGTSRVLGFTLLVAAIDVILLTAIATLGAFLYNMSAALLGGVEVTLAEESR